MKEVPGVIVRGYRTVGFGMRAESHAFTDYVPALPPSAIDEILARHRPSGHQNSYGFNAGAPVDGLSEFVAPANQRRYAADCTGSSLFRVAVDETTVDEADITMVPVDCIDRRAKAALAAMTPRQRLAESLLRDLREIPILRQLPCCKFAEYWLWRVRYLGG